MSRGHVVESWPVKGKSPETRRAASRPPTPQPTVKTITASILYDLIHCARRVHLDEFGNRGQRDPVSPFVELLWERGQVYEKDVIKGLAFPVADLSNLSGKEKELATNDAFARGEKLIYSGRISFGSKLGEPDLLRQEKSGYVAGDIKSGAGLEGKSDLRDGKPKPHYAVQLALYTDILLAIGQGTERRAFVWDIHGNEIPYVFDDPVGKKSQKTLWDLYEKSLDHATAILTGRVETKPAYTGICKLCHWYHLCLQELEAADDLTLIPELGRTRRDSMFDRIPTVNALARADLADYQKGDKTVFSRIGIDTLASFQHRACLISTPDSEPLIDGNLQLPAPQREIFFDVETDPMRDFCYLHGFYVRDGNGEGYSAFFADDPTAKEEEGVFKKAYEFLNKDKDAVFYYYSPYERTIWRGLQKKYPSVCSTEDIESLFSPGRSVDLYTDVVKKHTEWPTYSKSIKALAKYLGFSWQDRDPSGASSIEWYSQWKKTRNNQIKKRIIQYNCDDCEATAVLLDGIRDRLGMGEKT